MLAGALLGGCAATQSPTTDPMARGPAAAAPEVATRPEAAPVAAPVAQAPAPQAPPVAAVVATPAPIEEITPPQPAVAPEPRDLWARMRAGFAMPELDSALVAEKERFYLQKPDSLRRMFERGGRYLYFIVDELEKRGMPAELALLPFVESAMNPRALSPAQAAGLWQFIPSTGRQYKLSQNWWVDNRRDVVHSTHAALEYLQYIYGLQGNDWFLALASYNWGEGSVQRAMKKNAARGLPTDYVSLTMPDETRHYVPKLIALKNIVLRAEELGIQLPPLPNKPYFVTVEKTRPIDLKLAARFAGMSVDEFVALNPAHNRPVIAATKNNQIKLPIDRIDAFMDAVAKHTAASRPLASWQPYTLQPGESLEQVAARGGASVAEIRVANGLQASARLLPGTRLLAPQPDAQDETLVESFVAPRVYEAVDRPPAYHTVAGKSESVHAVAQRYGITAAALRAWNNVKASLRRGMTLLVRPASTQTILTTESGDRQVVATAVRGVAAQGAASVSEGPAGAEDAQPQRASLRDDAPKVAERPAAPIVASRPVGRTMTAAFPTAPRRGVAERAATASPAACKPSRREAACGGAAASERQDRVAGQRQSVRAPMRARAVVSVQPVPARGMRVERAQPIAERKTPIGRKPARSGQEVRADARRDRRA